jgi:hypothetical protein
MCQSNLAVVPRMNLTAFHRIAGEQSIKAAEFVSYSPPTCFHGTTHIKLWIIIQLVVELFGNYIVVG